MFLKVAPTDQPEGDGKLRHVGKIYTGKGDDGTTSLWYGGRVAKSDARCEAYGVIDEAVSAIGVARAGCSEEEISDDLLWLQRSLFVAGAQLATAPEAEQRLEDERSRVSEQMVGLAEQKIDDYMAQVDLPPKFVVSGGSEQSAQLDVARATLRRAERRAVELSQREELDQTLLKFLNRASDLLFALARVTDVEDPELFEGRA